MLWLVVGMAWVPSTKIYQQGLVALLWLPAFLLIWFERERLKAFFRSAPVGVYALTALVAWAAISLSWSGADDLVRQAKRIGYVALLLIASILVGFRYRSESLERTAWWVMMALVAAGLASIMSFYWLGDRPLAQRLEGIGRLSHPIMGAYVFGIAFAALAVSMPHRMSARAAWGVGLVILLLAIGLTQSRGAGVAVIGLVCLLPLWRPSSRIAWIVASLVLLAGALTYVFFEPYVMARGASYRPEIMAASLQMIMADPLFGRGVGASYEVVVEGVAVRFDHSHSLLLHTGIELGLPGALLWIAIWISVVTTAWQERRTPLGSMLLAMVSFAIMATFFDVGRVWTTPRAEWFVIWLPISLWLMMLGNAAAVRAART